METAVTIPMNAVESSQIAAIGHDPDTSTLAIQFSSKGDKPGSVYHYQNVDAELFREFAGAPSIGKHFYKHIKPFAEKFPYQKVS
jgi:hypothetical protein